LQYVFCVARIAGNAVGRPENEVFVLQKYLLQPGGVTVSGHDCHIRLRYLHCGLQLSTVLLSRCQTREEPRY
jgi:hypothetical protein